MIVRGSGGGEDPELIGMIRGTPGVFTVLDNAGSDPLSLVYASEIPKCSLAP